MPGVVVSMYFRVDTGRWKVKKDWMAGVNQDWEEAPCGCCRLMPMKQVWVLARGGRAEQVRAEIAQHYYTDTAGVVPIHEGEFLLAKAAEQLTIVWWASVSIGDLGLEEMSE